MPKENRGGSRIGAGRHTKPKIEKVPTSQITAQIPIDVKNEATAILKAIGMTPAQVVNMLFSQIIRDKMVPLSMCVETTKGTG